MGIKSLVYRPKGKALEYCELAANLYWGCAHGCRYCYVPLMTYRSREQFQAVVKPAKNALERLKQDTSRMSGGEEVHLCFTCDPYQPQEEKELITRNAIAILHSAGAKARILTKAGKLAQRDFDLLDKGDWFGQTLTCDNDKQSLAWEPGAALPWERIENLRKAHDKGIATWVSLEPVIYPDQTLNLIRQTANCVDEYKVGVLNYSDHARTINWPKFAREVKELLESLGKKYYLKEDLRKYLCQSPQRKNNIQK